jgi:hypothetical protein
VVFVHRLEFNSEGGKARRFPGHRGAQIARVYRSGFRRQKRQVSAVSLSSGR